VASPRRHEETEGQRQSGPIRGEEVGLCWLAEGARGIRFYKSIDEDDEDDWKSSALFP
jgi:hypothetical protein